MTDKAQFNTIRLIQELRKISGYTMRDFERQVIEQSAERLEQYAKMSQTEAVEDGPEEYYGPELVCRKCKTHWMCFYDNGLRFFRYCPGCGREVKWE